MQGMFDVLVPILIKAAEIAFFLGMSITGIRILMRAASGRDNWLVTQQLKNPGSTGGKRKLK